MCGIFLSACISPSEIDGPGFDSLSLLLQQVNAARGPDAQGSHTLSLRAASQPHSIAFDCDITPSTTRDETPHSLNIAFYGSELRLRGDYPILQPHLRDGNILCWNGEIFEGMEVSTTDSMPIAILFLPQL
jgi:asparagine synthetase B (glutamine-hydrolysing)